MLGLGLRLRIVLGCKVGKFFLWAALVPIERWVVPLATNCWLEAPKGGGGGGRGSWRPRTRGVPPPGGGVEPTPQTRVGIRGRPKSCLAHALCTNAPSIVHSQSSNTPHTDRSTGPHATVISDPPLCGKTNVICIPLVVNSRILPITSWALAVDSGMLGSWFGWLMLLPSCMLFIPRCLLFILGRLL